eukprot:TRINITY_DN9526_c0_g1_i1.p1 TRINITY_DN9526_c0_g1~~TRINITY_DN9526_c0_g1_i1.p1  ORF type:complete len:489 (+),score=81.31 TRINITY_DN9526_c0_g1_i1:764-2230(+)
MMWELSLVIGNRLMRLRCFFSFFPVFQSMRPAITSFATELLTKFGLEVEFSPERGRFVVARRPISAGEVVLCSPAYATIADAQHCDGCLQNLGDVPGKGLGCSCEVVHYCCEACCTAAAYQHKPQECSIFRAYKQSGVQLTDSDEHELLLAVRVLLLRQSEAETSGSSLTFEDVAGLVPHADKDPERFERNINLARLLLGFTGKTLARLPTTESAEQFVATLLCRMQCNDFSMWDDLLFPTASAVFPVGALLNHSCAANCVAQYRAGPNSMREQIFRSVRRISVGEEVTHVYLDVADYSFRRRAKLRAVYYFDCACDRCRNPPDIDHNSNAAKNGEPLPAVPLEESADQELRTAADDQKAAGSGMGAEEGIAMLKRVRAVYRKRLHLHHLARLSSACALLNLLLETGRVEEAVPICREVIMAYERAYSPHHPMLGLQFYTLADLCAESGDRPGELQAATAAHAILSVSHGADNKLVRSLEERLRRLVR